MSDKKYISATPEAGKAFYMRQVQGKVVMLNLLKYREVADYSQHPDLDPGKEISGEEAYQLYIDHTIPFIKEAGGRVIFMGKGGDFLIGPEAEKWDSILLVEHESAAKFLQFASNEGYLKGAGHRSAALEDSRLLPMIEGGLF